MFCCIFIAVVFINSISTSTSWDPSKFKFDPGPSYKLVWQDTFENVGPVKAIIDGEPAYAPNPKYWTPQVGSPGWGLQNFSDSIYNAYVQNNQLTIVAMKNLTSAMLTSMHLVEFTYGIFAAKIRLPYGQGIWPAWWLLGDAPKEYNIWWPTIGEIDIMEMIGGYQGNHSRDSDAHGSIHWNNASNTMNPLQHRFITSAWTTPDGSFLHNNSLVYWAEWNTTNIIIGVNEFVYVVYNTTNIPSSINPVYAWHGYWPFYMILNIAIGGPWPGPPDNTTVWPQKMVVDWVQVYQKSATTRLA